MIPYHAATRQIAGAFPTIPKNAKKVAFPTIFKMQKPHAYPLWLLRKSNFNFVLHSINKNSALENGFKQKLLKQINHNSNCQHLHHFINGHKKHDHQISKQNKSAWVPGDFG